jgi:superfamily I DNA/RNA helicase
MAKSASAEVAEAYELLKPMAEVCGEDLERFLSELSLETQVDTWDSRADRISLLTLHAAKGLEFSVVYIVGCEDGILPLTWGKAERQDLNDLNNLEDLNEERRVFYVGVTRAKTKLYLCRAKKRRWRGKIRELPPSPYLTDIEEQLLERQRSQIPGKPMKKKETQLELF